MPASDNAFKLMVTYQPEQFVAHFMPGAAFVSMLSPEFARDPARADALLKVRFPSEGGREYGLHFEVQSDADGSMPQRLCTYALLAMDRNKMPVVSIVIYLRPCSTPTPPWRVEGPRGPIIAYHYSVVRLWEEPIDDWIAIGAPSLLIFTPFLKGASPANLDPVVEILQQVPDPVQRDNCLHYLMLFAQTTFGVEIVHDFLRRHPMLDTFIQQSAYYQEILQRGREEGIEKGREEGIEKGREEGIEKGREEGIEKGREEGIEKGREEGEIATSRALIIQLVVQRFPTLEDEARAAVARLSDAAVLRDLVLKVALDSDEATIRALLA